MRDSMFVEFEDRELEVVFEYHPGGPSFHMYPGAQAAACPGAAPYVTRLLSVVDVETKMAVDLDPTDQMRLRGVVEEILEQREC